MKLKKRIALKKSVDLAKHEKTPVKNSIGPYVANHPTWMIDPDGM